MSVGALIIIFALWTVLIWIVVTGLSVRNIVMDAQPSYWLLAIFLCISGPIISYLIAKMYLSSGGVSPAVYVASRSFHTISAPIYSLPSVALLGAMAIYVSGVLFLMLKIVLPYVSLMKIAKGAPDLVHENTPVIFTNKSIAPCSFGVLNPKIIVPSALVTALTDKQLAMIYAHEQAHISHHDQRTYLALLFVKTVCWPHLAIADLIKRWRTASELRADSYALNGRSVKQRQDYGKMLLGILRNKGGRTLPCPSATLHLSNYRSAKMRVNNIMNPKQYTGKRHSKKLGLGAAALLLSGVMGMSAIAGESASPDKNAQPETRYPPMFPTNCPVNEGDIAAKVYIKFDVDKDGRVENVRVTKSDNPCFNEVSSASVKKWLYKPNTRKLKNVETLIAFKVAQ